MCPHSAHRRRCNHQPARFQAFNATFAAWFRGNVYAMFKPTLFFHLEISSCADVNGDLAKPIANVRHP
jgi:hypothetical protein